MPSTKPLPAKECLALSLPQLPLASNQEIWESVTYFKAALPIQPWYKIAIHNIPTSFYTNESLAILNINTMKLMLP
ncbi:hypothetical protein EJ02DRAFT_429365 [Clathrospora elynae]|uniref:Uncharacterized protein n=1 Tax=Clathrospora elynae TaxID=706981 RepID=A0A6A5S538_9PLEO|nr:hypothetical protein EJ02DRAFT_429365 [Clathrospora elynae]